MRDTPKELTCGSCFHCKTGPLTKELTRTYACKEGPPDFVPQGIVQDQKTGGVTFQMGIMYKPVTADFPACDRHKPKAAANDVAGAFSLLGGN